MSKAHSPTRFNGEADSFYDSNFTLDINKRMRVPKSIRVSGDYTDENVAGTNGSSWNQMLANEKFEMHVPDRILVAGQDQHVGTKAPPREIILENSVMPPEPGMIRVQTPPRVLTLDDHFFPAVDEEDPNEFTNENTETPSTVSRSRGRYNNDNQIVRQVREQTPSYNSLDVSLPPSEEIQHLRRQVGKLTRRILAVEVESQQRQQRDKILYAVALSYFFLKTFFWLSRN
ncbi:transport and Golgi organization protein 11 [Diprion similis]|uniref:transport and Golgi organization protein 11 n=1 Tax=Diprion similis TaxID=362088 RepID=UPI001EF7F94A|nr:transport and Golgi organization protein 11 [Diprion similis]